MGQQFGFACKLGFFVRCRGAILARKFFQQLWYDFSMNTVISRPLAKKKSSGTLLKRRQTTGRVLSAPLRAVPKLSMDDESFLSGITTTGQFTIQNSQGMYAGVRPLRNVK